MLSDSEAPSPVALAMDWGGTWARAAVIDRQGTILWQDRVANEPGALQDQLVHAAGGLLQAAKDWAGGRTVAGVGIALAGSIDAASNMLLSSPNLPALNGVTLPALWEPMLGAPVWVGNDANLAALGEYYYGAGRPIRPQDTPSRTLVFITFSTGVGAGIVDRGEVFTGSVGAAGEVGHMTIDLRADAPACSCGNSGCLEALASGTAIARAAQARLADATPGSPLQRAYEANASLTGEAVFAAAARGDNVALEVIEAAVGAIIVGLGNVLNIFNPRRGGHGRRRDAGPAGVGPAGPDRGGYAAAGDELGSPSVPAGAGHLRRQPGNGGRRQPGVGGNGEALGPVVKYRHSGESRNPESVK